MCGEGLLRDCFWWGRATWWFMYSSLLVLGDSYLRMRSTLGPCQATSNSTVKLTWRAAGHISLGMAPIPPQNPNSSHQLLPELLSYYRDADTKTLGLYTLMKGRGNQSTQYTYTSVKNTNSGNRIPGFKSYLPDSLNLTLVKSQLSESVYSPLKLRGDIQNNYKCYM